LCKKESNQGTGGSLPSLVGVCPKNRRTVVCTFAGKVLGDLLPRCSEMPFPIEHGVAEMCGKLVISLKNMIPGGELVLQSQKAGKTSGISWNA